MPDAQDLRGEGFLQERLGLRALFFLLFPTLNPVQSTEPLLRALWLRVHPLVGPASVHKQKPHAAHSAGMQSSGAGVWGLSPPLPADINVTLLVVGWEEEKCRRCLGMGFG